MQLHGGYGYMLEYPIARAYADARVRRIYGGTTEIMKEIIGRSLLKEGRGTPKAPSGATVTGGASGLGRATAEARRAGGGRSSCSTWRAARRRGAIRDDLDPVSDDMHDEAAVSAAIERVESLGPLRMLA